PAGTSGYHLEIGARRRATTGPSSEQLVFSWAQRKSGATFQQACAFLATDTNYKLCDLSGISIDADSTGIVLQLTDQLTNEPSSSGVKDGIDVDWLAVTSNTCVS